MHAPRFWDGKSSGARIFPALLSPLAALYGFGTKWKNRSKRPFQPRARVVCVGNLTLGGTGKTPVALALAELFARRGEKVVFLSRGYRGRLKGPIIVEPAKHAAVQVGDEPLLLARIAPTIVSRDRAAGAAMADTLGAEIIIMDDGHQNHSLRKDLSLVVLDAVNGFGNARLFPAGPLREPIENGLARADAVIIIGDEDTENERLKSTIFSVPVIRARLTPSGGEDIRGKRLVAFAGIGRPEKFFATLKELGGKICASHSFADHYSYSESDIKGLRAEAVELDARLVTTEKDFVRIAPDLRASMLSVPIKVNFEDEPGLARTLSWPQCNTNDVQS